jgi:hypothetical protein
VSLVHSVPVCREITVSWRGTDQGRNGHLLFCGPVPLLGPHAVAHRQHRAAPSAGSAQFHRKHLALGMGLYFPSKQNLVMVSTVTGTAGSPQRLHATEDGTKEQSQTRSPVFPQQLFFSNQAPGLWPVRTSESMSLTLSADFY